MSETKHPEVQMQAVRDALAETLGDAYDCMRVWSAWGVGTMSQDDFVMVAEDDARMHELTIAALDAAASADTPKPSDAALDLMDRQGGSFIKALAHCYLMADPENKQRLRVAMHGWFATYENHARVINNFRFKNISCSQCGESFGAGDNGFSHCHDHAHLRATGD